nr:MAG TPA: antitermination protein [Caudoviricetes sp.]
MNLNKADCYLHLCPHCSGKGLILDFWSKVFNEHPVLEVCQRCGGIGLVLTLKHRNH